MDISKFQAVPHHGAISLYLLRADYNFGHGKIQYFGHG